MLSPLPQRQAFLELGFRLKHASILSAAGADVVTGAAVAGIRLGD